MSFYDEPLEIYECSDCSEKSETLDEIKSWFTEVLEQLYGKDPLDKDSLQNCLDEIAHQLGLRLPNGELQINRKNNEKVVSMPNYDEIEAWKKWNNEYLNALRSQF